MDDKRILKKLDELEAALANKRCQHTCHAPDGYAIVLVIALLLAACGKCTPDATPPAPAGQTQENTE